MHLYPTFYDYFYFIMEKSIRILLVPLEMRRFYSNGSTWRITSFVPPPSLFSFFCRALSATTPPINCQLKGSTMDWTKKGHALLYSMLCMSKILGDELGGHIGEVILSMLYGDIRERRFPWPKHEVKDRPMEEEKEEKEKEKTKESFWETVSETCNLGGGKDELCFEEILGWLEVAGIAISSYPKIRQNSNAPYFA